MTSRCKKDTFSTKTSEKFIKRTLHYKSMVKQYTGIKVILMPEDLERLEELKQIFNCKNNAQLFKRLLKLKYLI